MSRQLPHSYKAQLLKNAFLCSAHSKPDGTGQAAQAPGAGGCRWPGSRWDRAERAPCPPPAAGEAGPQRGMNCMDLCVCSMEDRGPLSSSLHVSSMSALRDFLHSIF